MSLIEVSTRRRVTIFMATITVCLFGMIALFGLKVNLLPDLSYPTLTVRTEYSGAAPVEIENLISEPVEEALGVVKNVRRVKSVSRAGQSDVILEFAWGTDMDLAGLEVREKLEVLMLPLEATRPQLLRFDPSTEPILRYALMGVGASDTFNQAELKQLRRYADEQLKKRLEPVAGVAAVKIGGGLEDEIQVEIDQQKLKQLNLSVGAVIDRLRAENVNVSGGRLDEGSQRYLVRTINQFATVEEIGAMLLSPNGQVTLRLRDIATVRQGFRERESVIRVDGREAVEIAIYKEGDANTVAVAESVQKAVAQLQDSKQLPANAKLENIDDQSRFIRGSLDEVKSAAIQGGLLSILVIFLFLRDAWSTFVIGVSLPVSIIATFFFMGQFGISLNVMSLGGLALATGMVVDAAIVVLENISRLRDKGVGILEAAIKGTQQVGMAVTASVLTSVAVFFPLVFVEGVSGQLFRDQALTVTISLLVSLVVSLTLIPMLSSLRADIGRHIAGDDQPEPPGPLPHNPVGRFFVVIVRIVGLVLRFLVFWVTRLLSRIIGMIGMVLSRLLTPLAALTNRAQGTVEHRYAKFLPYALMHPMQILGVALLAFVASLMLVPGLGIDLVPQLAQGQYEATLKLPPGTPLARTDTIVREMQRRHMDDPEIATIYGVSGAGTRLDANPTESGENIGRLVIGLAKGADAAAEARSMAKLRKSAEALGVRDANFARPALLNYSTPLEIEIAAYDLDRLKAAGRAVVAALNASDRYTDVKSTVEQGQPEIQIRFDQERAAALGLSTRQIADQVVRKVRGEVATRYSYRERKIDVLVRALEQDRASVEDIRNLIVNPQSDKPVTLSAVADIVATEGPGEIRRSDQERVAIVSANLAYGDLGTAASEARRLMAAAQLPAGVDVRVSGQSEELQASVDSLVFALLLAVFLVYLVMASQFESLLHPFVILFSIPLAVVGAVVGLKLFGMPLSVIAGIGIIMLAGIVVNNAIVLIDRVNQLRGDGVSKFDALIEGGRSRLRAITMTTVTTLVGFLPMAIGLGDGAEIRQPMAVTVIAGLTVSTVLTLVVIPVVYMLMDRRPDSDYVEAARRAELATALAE
ncbi:MAG TPA: efflux RND transporter permease subunit [Pseudomonadota bacterium]|nr:efflux RND transporter permease subunit [Xanthomonadales bacterium]HQW80819.1 efflux RND transporter permease subunit [Pseudomonadota bacterium]